jgi:hypothetical protein
MHLAQVRRHGSILAIRYWNLVLSKGGHHVDLIEHLQHQGIGCRLFVEGYGQIGPNHERHAVVGVVAHERVVGNAPTNMAGKMAKCRVVGGDDGVRIRQCRDFQVARSLAVEMTAPAPSANEWFRSV